MIASRNDPCLIQPDGVSVPRCESRAEPLNRSIRQPRNIDETGLSQELINGLLLKHLYDGVVLDLPQLRDRIKLSGNILEPLLQQFRKTQRILALSPAHGEDNVRYQLTDLGRADAAAAMLKSGYIGPAPISLDHYAEVVGAQSVLRHPLTRDELVRGFEGIVIERSHLDVFGPALNSGKPILVYGHSGTGKTFICKKLSGLLGGSVYLPYAIAAGQEIIQYYDPLIHSPVRDRETAQFQEFKTANDPRLIRCKRPVAISGGELTMDSLEIKNDRLGRIMYAPVQLKANNGIYIIDDLGRQRMEPAELFNRWIVPMEERHDYLVTSTGRQFRVPFDCVLIFSTNLEPADLADEAFLRRLGYKIHFTPITQDQFTTIWNNLLIEKGIQVEEGALNWIFDKFRSSGRELLPCYPRDLMETSVDLETYLDNKGVVKANHIEIAWDTYFMKLQKG
ncbi:MAG: hypothetical protein L0Y38_12430 [Methylococcaceae bacterium]|nr:hypothetical protein [Methylococcaceae bacterium]